MSNEAKLVVEPRSELGSAACRRLRKRGLVPGNIYGHNSPETPVVVSSAVLMPVVKSKHRVVDVEISGKQEKAILRDIKWDVFGNYLEHFDLMRVDPNERVTISVPLELKGTAPGSLSGGVLEQPLHALVIDCLALQIPDSIQVRIGSLEVGQAIHVGDLQLPEGCRAHAQADAIVVHVVKVQQKDLVAETAAAEPEVVGKKPADEAAAAKDDKDKKK